MNNFESMIDNFISSFQFPIITKQDIESAREEAAQSPEIKNLDNEISQLKAVQHIFP